MLYYLKKMKKPILSPKEKKTLLENFLSLSSQQAVAYLLPVLVLPYLVRVLGPERFGLLAFAQAFVQYFMLLTDYGFNISAVREIALSKSNNQKTSRIFSAVMLTKLALTIVGFIILFLVVNFLPRFKQEKLLFFISFGAVIGYSLFPVWLYQGKEKMKYIAIINVLGAIVYTLLIFILIKKPADYLKVALLNSLFFMLTGIIGLCLAVKKFTLRFSFFSYAHMRQELKAGWPVFVSIAAINGYTATRVFAVGLLTTNTITGFYAVAERIANFVQTFPLLSLSQALYPRLAKIFQKNQKRAFYFMQKIQNNLNLIYALIILALIWQSPLLSQFICGELSEEVVLALRLLLIGVFLVVANALRVQFLLVGNRPDLYAKLHIYAAAVGIPLLFVLVAHLSYRGAAFSTLLIESGVLLATIFMVKKIFSGALK